MYGVLGNEMMRDSSVKFFLSVFLKCAILNIWYVSITISSIIDACEKPAFLFY
jgi:hypothetical protein